MFRRRHRPRPAAILGLAAVVVATTVATAAVPAAAAAPSTPPPPTVVTDPTLYVNPRVGNTESGTTWPGASMPFGMVQNSPDTRRNSYTSYDYGDGNILGFSQDHLSGVGCPITGDIKIMPTLGTPTGVGAEATASSFRHASEVERPGYYAVTLDRQNIRAELTATTRTGADRFTYPAGSGQPAPTLLVNVADGNGSVFASDVHVVGNDTVEGSVTGGAFCGEAPASRYTVYFSMKASATFASFATWQAFENAPSAGRRDATGGAALTLNAPAGSTVTTVTGLSYTSVAGARANRVAEQGSAATNAVFDRTAAAGSATWRSELAKISVGSPSKDDLMTFYTALYHSLLHPSVGSDVDGSYRGFDGNVHKTSPGTDYYQMLSLWDTYRSQNQLVALVEPRRATDIARSILAIATQGGWVPRWALGQSETNVMSGDPVTPFIVSLYQRGLLDPALAEGLFLQLWKNATQVPPATQPARGRDGNPDYLLNGWIGYSDNPGARFGDTRQAGSATLEYALGDCALAGMARGLGHAAAAAQLATHCDAVTGLWNAASTSKGYSGFPQARTADGAWAGPTDPAQSVGFHEGTSWQYQWLAQQDPAVLFGLMGGAGAAERRLDTFFSTSAVLADPRGAPLKNWVVGAYDYHNNFAFNPNNEPDMHSPWMYAWTASPWKTSAIMRSARTLFTNTPTGLPGNDDLGALSSWMVFAMLGIFEATPGSGNYVVTAPMLPLAHIQVPAGADLTISAPGASSSMLQYVATTALDGRDTRGVSWLTHATLLSSRRFDVSLTSNPAGTQFGVGSSRQPPAMAAAVRR